MHAQKLVEKANDAKERRAYDLAIELYMQAVTLEPDHLEARRGLRSAELKKTEAYYPSAVTRVVGSVPARISAWFAKVSKNHEKRMLALEKILVQDPKNVKISQALAQTAEAAGHKNAGIAAYEGVIEADPDNLVALKGLGRLLSLTGEPRRALELYERALRVDPRDQEASRMRKNIAAEVSITKTGVDRAQHSRDLMVDRENQEQLHDEARVLRGEEDIRASVEQIETQLKEKPEDGLLLSELASRYTAIREYDKAIETYDRAYAAQPNNFLLREKAGDLRISRFDREIREATQAGDKSELERLGAERLEFVVDEYRKRVQEHPTDLGLHFQLGKALHESGDLDGAMSEFQQTVRDPRRKIESLTMLGNCFIEKGMFDLAESQLRKALDESPGMSERKKEILYNLGLLKEKQGDVPAALAEFKKIYEVDIQYKDVGQRMEKLKEEAAG